MKIITTIFVIISTTVFYSCSGSSSHSNNTPTTISPETPLPTTETRPSPEEYIPISTTYLISDGPEGENTLDVIYGAFGVGAAETPGIYIDDHYGVDHIYEDTDSIVGNHFIFTSHLDLDGDRGEFIDRQRNEIKIFNHSDESLKGYENTSFTYNWKFKIPEDMEFSRYATHLFQLKMKDGVDSSPILTITVSEENAGIDTIQLRYVPDGLGSEVLTSIPLDEVSGEWLNAHCFATFSEQGQLQFSLSRLSNQEELLNISDTAIDMWREIDAGRVGYVRPKWGIYRRIDNAENLRSDEEVVRFADFEISAMEVLEQ